MSRPNVSSCYGCGVVYSAPAGDKCPECGGRLGRYLKAAGRKPHGRRQDAPAQSFLPLRAAAQTPRREA